MKIINDKEQKQLLLKMLQFFDKKCRDNSVKYSLMSGSLIGAIRHKGFIPWDDDVDIILTKQNYERIKQVLNKETGRYQTLKYGQGGECFSFLKLIDTHTQMQEGKSSKFNPYYGVFLDIFCYYPTSDDYRKRKAQCKKLEVLMSLIARRKLDIHNISFGQNVMRLGKNTISILMGYKRINQSFNKTLTRYNDSKYVVSNWPAYGFEKEIQFAKNTKSYIDVPFEDLTIMVFKNYHEILSTTYGDYMKLPPKSEQVPKHNTRIWWRGESHE